MAEETIDNAENLSNQNFDDFIAKSDFLNPARIEQNIEPILNWRDNFINPTNFIKDNTSGIPPNVPPSAINQLKESGVIDPFEAIAMSASQSLHGDTDYGTYAKPYAYNAGPSGTFKDRYKGYGQDTYNNIGFHPLIDNETWFNQNTTFGDDLKRWATHSAWPLLTKGIIDPIKSYKSIIDGDGLFYADPESARDYEYYNALGQSTRGGVSQFTVNLLNSASYSMGILLEGAMEGALIGSLFGGPAGAAKGSMNALQKLANLPRGFANLAKGTTKLFDDVAKYTSISESKNYWKAAGENFGNFINPLQNTLTALRNVDNLTNLARNSATAGAFWHDIMNLNLALSEGKLEGGFTRNELYDKLYNKFIEDHNGKTPTIEEQEALMIEASKGSWWNTHNNTALIFLSNKLAFPSITKASFLRGVPKFSFGTTVTNVGKEYQILFEPGKKALEGKFVKQKISFINALKSLGKPSTYGKVGLNYFKANLIEGLQEVSQDILQEATQDYYVSTFNNKDARTIRYGAGILSDAIEKQWSAQGLETFLSGFLMGTILQAPGKIKNYATIGYNDYFKKDASFQNYMKNREQMADDIVNELNNLYENANYFFDPRISNYAQQALALNVIDDPDNHTTKELRDSEFTAFQSALFSSLERGTFNLFLEHYKKYEQATASDIEEAWDLKPGEGEKALSRFQKSLDEAEKIAYRYNTAKDKMKEFRINLNDYEKDTEEYRMAKVFNKAFNLALHNYVFLHDSYDNNLERIDALYRQFSSITALAKTPMTNITALVDPDQLKREVEMLKNEIETLESVTTQEAIAEVGKKRELLELYSRYNDNLEQVYGLFANKEVLNAKIKEIEEDINIDSEEEEVVLEVYRSVVKQFEDGLTTTDKTFKESFNDLILGLGETNEDRRKIQDEMDKQGGIDDLYDALLDTLLLKNETSVLNQYTNLLASPNGFYEHVVRNFQFMRELYNNREDIVKEIVNQEISAIERNTLLNTLADEGIFLDLEEFSKWVEDHSYRPKEFIDVKNNRVITEDSLIYEDYIDILRRAAQLDERKPAGEQFDLKQQLDRKVNELVEERDRLIQKEKDKFDAAFEKKYGLSPEQYEAEEAKRIAGETITPERKKELEDDKKILEDAIKSLNESTSAVIIQAAADVIANKIMSKDNIKAPDYFAQQIDQILINSEKKKQVDELSPTITQAEDSNQMIDAALKSIIYKEWATQKLGEIDLELTKDPAATEVKVEETKEYISFQEAVKAITEKYDQLIADVKSEFEKKGVNENTAKVYSTKSDFQDFDPEFKQEITKLFEEYLVDTLEESIELKNTNPEQYERLRKNWLETQSELINSFNKRSKQKAEEKVQRLSQPPKLTFIDKQIGANNTTYEIAQIIKVFEKYLKDNGYTNKKGEFVKLTKGDTEKIKNDLEALKGYLKARVDVAAPRNIAEETVNIIQDNIINKQDELEDVFDEDGNKIGRKFKDSKNLPERTSKVAEEIENAILDKDDYIYFALKDKVDSETGEILEKSRIEKLYDLIYNDPNVAAEDKVNAFMTAFEQKVYTKGTKENPSYPAFAYPEKLAAIRNSLETDGSYEGLRNVLIREAHRESSHAGNVVDDLIRIFLTPNASTKSGFSEFTYDSEIEIKGVMTKISDTMSRKAFDKLFAPVSLESGGGIVTKFRLGVVDGSYIILSENVKLFDRNLRENGVTGEVDLILVREDGSVAIVDIKTTNAAKWAKFGTREGYESSVRYSAQQSIYGTMFYNNTGITPDIKLMPFKVELSDTKVGYIEDIDLALDEIEKANAIIEKNKVGTPFTINADTFDLEYLPEIEEFGITKTEPENVIKRTKEEVPTEPKDNTIPVTDPTKLTLQDNVGKMVMYKGRAGILIQMADGTFAIEVPISADISTIQISLESLKANKVLAQEYGSQEEIQDLNNQIDRLEKAIQSQQGLTEVFPIEKLDVNIVNEKLTLADVGLQIIVPVESIGQVSVIQGEVVDVSFSNAQETVASINGVRYDVNRDNTGTIISLSYQSNDVEIARLDKEIGEKGNQIGRLRERVKTEEDQFKRNRINDRIFDLQGEISLLSARRTSLYNSNKTQYLYGANANNYIFALNRLPNNFQKLTQNSNKLDEIRDLKLIDQLSLSTAVSQAITEIIAKNYPEALDRLLEGYVKSPVYSTDLLKIDLWIKETIESLYQLGYTVLNRGDLTDDIQGQINALLDLQNDLGLIKLTKDGKIKNVKKVRKVFTEGQQVQERTRVPKNEKSTGGQTEGGTRPATREELREIVKESRKKIDPELEDIPEATQEDIKLNELIENINNAKLDNIESVYRRSVLDAMKNKLKIPGLKKAYEARLNQLNTQISLETVNKNEYLISKNSIFEDPAGTIYQIVRVNKESVRLRNIVSQDQNTVKEEQLMENFEKTTEEATQPTPEVEVDVLDIEGSNESKDVVKDLANDTESTNAAKENAEKSDVKSRFDKLNDNSKKC